ncbi:MAG: beta-galactosidase GalB [Chthoniobacteraceae bacterium]
MQKTHHLIGLVTAMVFMAFDMAVFSMPLNAQDWPRKRVSLDADWRFQKNDPQDANGKLDYPKIKDWITATGNELRKDSGAALQTKPPGNPGGEISYAQSGFDDKGWRQLNLPHDWGIEGPFKQEYPGETGKLPWWGVGWYRKHFNVTDAEKSKQFFLEIDGAMSCSMVWLNGKFVGGWPYGYASFQLDLTPYIQPGENVIAVRLDNPPNSSRWYPGGGIYRNVWLVKTEPIHVGHWGVYVTTPAVDEASATVHVKVQVDKPETASAAVKTEIFEAGPDGGPTGGAVASSQTSGAQEIDLDVPRPKLWSLETRNLYVAVTSVFSNNKLADHCQTVFGIRTIKFDKDKGVLLNGRHVKLNGVCDHHDLGALGTAINVRALQRQIELLQEMGCNAIRTSHNPPAPELLDLCDRMGMLVMDEYVDCWEMRKTPNDYHQFFDDWHEKDLRAQVRRDRNHPCVVLWSIGNEIPEQSKPQGPKMAAELTAIVHEEDPTRPTTFACSDVHGGYNGYQTGVDVFGYNYKPGEYGKFHAAHPDIPIFGSETSSTVSSRGEYAFPPSSQEADAKTDFQVSSYDLYAPRWATTPDAEFKAQDQNPFVAGEFVWTGFDYLGEPTPYNKDSSVLLNFHDPAEKAKAEQELAQLHKVTVPSRSSYFGIIDLAGFRKDRFYLYQSKWRPDFPMAHILPHWNWPERVGQVTPVFVYTSGDEAELFLNGKSLGRKKKGDYEYRLRWDDVVYQPGELKVVAYKDGKEWAQEIVKTTGPASQVMLKADRPKIAADGLDLSYVTVTIADKDGLMVPRSKNLVQFDISGPAEIIGVDNGDATSHDSFQAKQVKAFNGLALVIVRAKAGQPGAVVLHAKSEGLQPANLSLQSE